MSEGELSRELQKFIARSIESVEKLEILLLLSKSPDKVWSVREVFQTIQSNLGSVAQKLKDLSTDGLVSRETEDCFRFAPKTPELATLVAELDRMYEEKRIRVIQTIFSDPTNELRSFSD